MTEQIMVADEQKMLAGINELPVQLEKAWTELWIKDVVITKEINSVIVAGMGGSGIAGQLAAELYSDEAKVPIISWADYGLPAWAGNKTLLVAISCSGNTEETLDGVKKALERQLSVVAITSGGKLEEMAKIYGFPLVKVSHSDAPRAKLGSLYGSLLTVLAKLKIIPLTEKLYFEAVAEVKNSVSQKQFGPKAEELAVTLNNKVPAILAYPPLAAVARRYVTQLNENSKTFATSLAIPEACHNFIVGLDFPIPEKLAVLLLESKFGFSRNVARKKVLEKLFASKDILTIPLSVKSGSALAEQLLLTHFGDLLSFYLAGVVGVDPSPVEAIDFLKTELAKL